MLAKLDVKVKYETTILQEKIKLLKWKLAFLTANKRKKKQLQKK